MKKKERDSTLIHPGPRASPPPLGARFPRHSHSLWPQAPKTGPPGRKRRALAPPTLASTPACPDQKPRRGAENRALPRGPVAKAAGTAFQPAPPETSPGKGGRKNGTRGPRGGPGRRLSCRLLSHLARTSRQGGPRPPSDARFFLPLVEKNKRTPPWPTWLESGPPCQPLVVLAGEARKQSRPPCPLFPLPFDPSHPCLAG